MRPGSVNEKEGHIFEHGNDEQSLQQVGHCAHMLALRTKPMAPGFDHKLVEPGSLRTPPAKFGRAAS